MPGLTSSQGALECCFLWPQTGLSCLNTFEVQGFGESKPSLHSLLQKAGKEVWGYQAAKNQAFVEKVTLV